MVWEYREIEAFKGRCFEDGRTHLRNWNVSERVHHDLHVNIAPYISLHKRLHIAQNILRCWLRSIFFNMQCWKITLGPILAPMCPHPPRTPNYRETWPNRAAWFKNDYLSTKTSQACDVGAIIFCSRSSRSLDCCLRRKSCNGQWGKSRPGSISRRMLCTFTRRYRLQRQDFTHILFLLFLSTTQSRPGQPADVRPP